MAEDFKIGAGLALDGEADFKKAITGINKDLTVLGSEMKKVTAQFDGNANSMEALTAKQEVYNKRADEQRKKVELMAKALESAKKEFGENSDKVKDWQIKLNNAEADLAKTENSLKNTTKQIDEFGKEANDGGDEIEKAGKKAKDSGTNAEKGESGWAKLGSGLTKVAGYAAKAVSALGAAAAGAAVAVGGMTLKAAYAADDINTLAKQTGLSVEEIQKFQFASEQIDVPLETLTGSMAKLTKNMATAKKGTGDAAAAFAALGVNVTDSNGELRSNQDVFDEAIAALGRMENETQRDAYAMQIFGKSAQDLNPLILGGAESLKELGDQAEAAGLILGQDSLDNLNSLADAMDTFKATVSGTGNLLSTAFAAPMAEGLNTITGYIQQLAGAFKEGGFEALADEFGTVLTDITQKITEYMPKIVEFGTTIVMKLVEGISQNLPLIMQSALAIISQLSTSLVQMLPTLMQMGMEIILQLALGLADALPELIPAIVDTVLMIVDTLIDNIDLLVDASIAIIMALADGLIAALPRLTEKVPEIIIKMLNAFTENFPKVASMAGELILTLANGLIASIPSLLKSVPELVKALLRAWETEIDAFTSIGKNIVEGVWNGIKSLRSWFKDQISDFFGGIVKGVKMFLGINSPSTVFAGIGENMAAGLGVGFGDEMDGVASKMQKAVPTDMDLSYVTAGAKSGKMEIVHRGTIRAEGVNSKGELIATSQIIIEDIVNTMRREARLA